MIRFFSFLRALGAVAALCLAGGSKAAEPVKPDASLAPQQVVSIQLEALQNNDKPEPDSGIAQTFALAHPDNQKVTGPLARFALMIRSPAYRPLLDHRNHEIEVLASGDNEVRFKVTVETQDGAVLVYLWEVRRVTDGPAAGAWLTTAVSAPAEAGKAI